VVILYVFNTNTDSYIQVTLLLQLESLLSSDNSRCLYRNLQETIYTDDFILTLLCTSFTVSICIIHFHQEHNGNNGYK